MRKLIGGLVAALALLAVPLVASATAEDFGPEPVDNFGQCEYLYVNVFGGHASDLAPHGPESHNFGPAVVIYNSDGTVRAIHQAAAYDFGGGCNVVLNDLDHLTYRSDGTVEFHMKTTQ